MGTVVRITHSFRLPDGRIVITTKGFRRCQVLHHRWCDGYCVGQIQWLEDTDDEEGGGAAERMDMEGHHDSHGSSECGSEDADVDVDVDADPDADSKCSMSVFSF